MSRGDALSRRVYGGNPFPECRAAGLYLRSISTPGDRIGILGSEPQICVYAQRRKATPYLYMYPLMENHDLAEAMMRDFSERLRAAPPPYLVAVAVPVSWHEGGTSAGAAGTSRLATGR